MSASTGAREANKKPGNLVAFAMGQVKINKGTLVCVRAADGYVYPARSGTATDIFKGVAFETLDNSAGTAGAVKIRVERAGNFTFAKAAAVQTDLAVGGFYAADDQTLTATATNNQLVGYPVEVYDAGDLRIQIDNAVR